MICGGLLGVVGELVMGDLWGLLGVVGELVMGDLWGSAGGGG